MDEIEVYQEGVLSRDQLAEIFEVLSHGAFHDTSARPFTFVIPNAGRYLVNGHAHDFEAGYSIESDTPLSVRRLT